LAFFGCIGVLLGGCSSEREVSLKSGAAIYDALKNAGCRVESIDIQTEEPEQIKEKLRSSGINVAFIALHGRMGEDGGIQSILEECDIPYTGTGPEASRVCLNKVTTQDILLKNQIPVPKYITLHKQDQINAKPIFEEFQNSSLVVKPAKEGSSIGITIVTEQDQFKDAVTSAFSYDDEIIVEEFIQGKELTVGILNDRALAVVEIRPKRGFFDYTAKYQAGQTEYIVPADIPESLAQTLKDLAWQTHRILGAQDFSRVDFICDEKEKPFVLEINTIPGFTQTSLLPKAAAEEGINFTQLCLDIIESAYAKAKK